MDGSMGIGFMAAFAVSGSVVLIAREFHKRLFSDFMKKIELELELELELGTKKCLAKKRVRFAKDVIEPSSNNKEYRRRELMKNMLTDVEPAPAIMVDAMNQQPILEPIMPINRQNLYKGIIQYRTTLKGFNV